MEKFYRLLLLIFSIYRLASLIASEEGPYVPWLYRSEQQNGIFKWLRMKAGAYNYGPDGLPETNLGRGISCPLCVGAYVAVPLVGLSWLRYRVAELFLLWLGAWGAQVFLENLTSDDAIQAAIEDVAESLDDE